MTIRDIDRRSFLALAAGTGMATVAGCGGDSGSSDTPTETGGSTPTPSATPTDAETETDGSGTEMTASPTSSPSATPTDAETETDGSGTEMTASPTSSPSPTATSGPATWRTAELTDVLTGDSFTIGSFEGSPVMVETFAVWCPVCTRQQRAISKFRRGRDDLVVVSLNIDPNENATKVKKHAEDNGFDWRYAVSPPSVTRSLVAAFGSVITQPPSAPVVRVCPSGAAKLIDGTGVKSAGTLASSLDRC